MNLSKLKKIPWQKILSLVSLAILFWLFSKVDLQAVGKLWQSSNKWWVLVSVLALLFQLCILTLKWSILIKEKIPFTTLFKVNMIGAFFGTITPANTGTLIRAHYLNKVTIIGLAKAGSSVLLDKLLEITTLATLGLASIIGLSFLVVNQEIISFLKTLLLFLFSASMVLSVWLLTDKNHRKKMLQKLSSFLLPAKVYSVLKPYFQKVHPHLISPDKLIIPFLLNVAAYAVSYFYVLALVWAIGAEISYIHIFVTLPLSSLVALLPITISGIGTREAATVFLWNLFGVTPEQTLSIMLLAFVIGRGIPTLLGWIFLSTFKQKSSS